MDLITSRPSALTSSFVPCQGKIIGSMHLGDNIHAARYGSILMPHTCTSCSPEPPPLRFKAGVNKLKDGTLQFIKNPIQATRTFIKV